MLLHKLLPLAQDLDALCIDYLPDIEARFGTGWDLLSKQNLLLKLVSTESLLTVLKDRFRGNAEAEGLIQEACGRAVAPTKEELDNERRERELEQYCLERARRIAHGQDTTALDVQIKALKKSLRRLPQLQEYEILGDRYQVLSLIGKGGFARVYQAFDLSSQMLVAVKVLHSESSDDQRSVERFNRGAVQMQNLTHPNIVRVLGGPDEQDGFHYFVMEYLQGGDLHRAVCGQKLSQSDRLRLLLEVASALEFSHARGLVHRDVKPENILLDHRQSARLSDFDLVRAPDTTGGTRSHVGLGTFLYAAPEQLIDASRVDAKADVYGLGMVTLFVIHGGFLPVWLREHRQYFIHNLPLPAPLRQLLDLATSPDARLRPSLADFQQGLRSWWSSPTNDAPRNTLGISASHDFDSACLDEEAALPCAATAVISESSLSRATAMFPALAASAETPPRWWTRRSLRWLGATFSLAVVALLWALWPMKRPDSPRVPSLTERRVIQHPASAEMKSAPQTATGPARETPAPSPSVVNSDTSAGKLAAVRAPIGPGLTSRPVRAQRTGSRVALRPQPAPAVTTPETKPPAPREQGTSDVSMERLSLAQKELLSQNYRRAIAIALTVQHEQPERVWLLIARAACSGRYLNEIYEAFQKLNANGRGFLRTTCEANGVYPADDEGHFQIR